MKELDKAKELYNKFMVYEWSNENGNVLDKETTKEHALLCCDEILNAIYDNGTSSNYYKYWQEVKLEVEKL